MSTALVLNKLDGCIFKVAGYKLGNKLKSISKQLVNKNFDVFKATVGSQSL